MNRKIIAQICIGVVILSNMFCAVVFFFTPSLYTTGFELIGIPGETAIRGFGLLFIMWSIPYLFAIVDPIRNKISVYEAVAMQAVGLFGETWILSLIPPIHSALITSIQRFIAFDGAGLFFLLIALFSTRHNPKPTYRL